MKRRKLKPFVVPTMYVTSIAMLLASVYFVERLINNAVFENDKVVDDGVRAVKIGGHSKGSCIVECDKDGKKIVLCGDECYSFYNLKNRVPTAQSCCHKNSRAFIEKYSSEGYECLLCHKIK